MKENGDGVFPLALRRAARRRAFSSSVKWRVENLSPPLLWFKPLLYRVRLARSVTIVPGVSFFFAEHPPTRPQDHERR
jgi:hypothetical protein